MFARRERRPPNYGVYLLALQMIQSGPIPPVTMTAILGQIAIYLGYVPGMGLEKTRSMCLLPNRVLASGEWYRLIAPVFMHGDDMHLYFNMASLLYKGRKLEKHFGSVRFASILAVFSIASTLMTIVVSYLLDETLDFNYMSDCAVGFSDRRIAYILEAKCEEYLWCRRRLLSCVNVVKPIAKSLEICLQFEEDEFDLPEEMTSISSEYHDAQRSAASLEEFLSRQRLIATATGGSDSTSGSDSPSRASRISLIKHSRSSSSPRLPRWVPLTLSCVLVFILAIVTLLLFIALLRVRQEHLHCREEGDEPYMLRVREDTERLDGISDSLLNEFQPRRIRRNLEWMSRTAHIAGTVENGQLMRRLADEYTRLGLSVRLFNYSVLLNYPDFKVPNTIEVRDERGRWWTVSQGRGHPIGPDQAIREQSDLRSSLWWNAYSANGTVEGTVVYCNYGMREDFDQLEDMGVPVIGAIAVIRYGGIGRAEKIREAERRGAIGVILFSDPVHYTGVEKNRTFPHDVFLPGSDAQRGSVLLSHGDPLTPLYPSLPYARRSETASSIRDKGLVPSIPVMPIGYDDANRLFNSMDGEHVKAPQWRGGLTSPYRFSGSRTFKLSVRSRSTRRMITNVIATLKGREEPDKWVMVGNHVDAWGSGAIDPLSGTATQLEMARVATKIFSKRPPRRSIVFCHWDAEEFGLIGSTEWVEEMTKVLDTRAVAYINVDHIAGNTTLDVKAVPLLYRTIAEAAQRIPHPNPSEQQSGRMTLLESWKHFRGRGPISGDRAVPDIGLPASGSDYQRFISFAGIPSADLKLEAVPGQSYALYHTMYETMWTMENLIDPDFTSLTAVGQLWMEITHRLANRIVIPFNLMDYAISLSALFNKAESQMSHWGIPKFMPEYNGKVDNLRDSLRRFHKAARQFHFQIEDISSGLASVSLVRLDELNSRLQYIERVFLDPFGFPSPLYRHLIFSPSRHPPTISSFSSLLDSAMDFVNSRNITHIDNVDMAFTRIQYALESAIHLLS